MKCVVSGCSNTWRKEKKKENISFHKFPKSNYKTWLECIGIYRNTEWPANKKMCSVHFTDDCFLRTGLNVRLKPDSKPTLHLLLEDMHSEHLGSSSGESTVTLQSPEKKYVESESTITVSSPENKYVEASPLPMRKTVKRLLYSPKSSTSSTVSKRARVVRQFHNYSFSFDDLKNKYLKNKAALEKTRQKYHNAKKTVKRIKKKVQSLYLVLNTLKKTADFNNGI